MSNLFLIAERENMAYLTGILIDVSNSMSRNIGSGTDEEGGPWARSIFEVIDNLIKNDVSSDSHVFAIGVGARTGEDTFDVLGTLKQIQYGDKKTEDAVRSPATSTQVDMIFRILERSGAGTVRKWAAEEDVIRASNFREADLLLNKLNSDRSFLETFVQEILPPACRDWSGSALEEMTGLSFVTNAVQGAFVSVATSFVRATVEDIREVVNQAKPYLLEEEKEKVRLSGVTVNSIFKVKDASSVLHGCVDEKELSKERCRELLQSVEPYIYGRTPLYQSIEEAIKLFQASSFTSHKKLLLILSDGEPTDGETTDRPRIDRLTSELNTAGATVVSCFVTNSTEIYPKRLYSKERPDWEPGAKFLFSLSSKETTQSLPRTIFVKREWFFEFADNKTHLFLQVNHPDNLRDACDMARKVVCSQDALSDVLASVDLDFFVNQQLEDYEAQEKQVGRTCYANAAATVLYLSMKRVLGREGGYPDFKDLLREIVDDFGSKGAKTFNVLQMMCRKYRLKCKQADIMGALKAVSSSRPVVAIFRLTQPEWRSFKKFFKRNGKGILTKKEIDRAARPPNAKVTGHAVVLTSFDSDCLRLLNSWGEDWADIGFFRVKNADVLGFEFIDVLWEKEDLTPAEKAYFKKHGSDLARNKLIEKLPSLKEEEYTCQKCSKSSKVSDFTGTLLHATCPKCGEEFATKDSDKGNILALNIYLTSLNS